MSLQQLVVLILGMILQQPVDWVWTQNAVLAQVQRQAGAPVEVLDLDDARRRFGDFDPTGLAGATFGPIDGVVDPHSVTLAYLARARDLGATVRLRSEVTAIDRDGDGWSLEVSGRRLRAATVVNAAGAWSGEVGRLAGVEVPVEPARRMVWMTGPKPGRATTPLTVDVATGTYFRSEGERLLFGRSNPAEPPGFHEGIDWAFLEPTLEAACARFPWFADEELDARACWYGYYEMTPDDNAVLGAVDGVPGWVNACGFSGHGVQQAPAVGRAIREEVVDGRAHTIDIDPLRIGRFRRGDQRHERHVI
jgi:sarcosine oxidase subunit beta